MNHFNLRMYKKDVLSFIPDIGEDDLKWICNKASSIYKKLDQCGCVDNFRVSRVSLSNPYKPSDVYMRSRSNGCCGFYDQIFLNLKTGNLFFIGFNYGH